MKLSDIERIDLLAHLLEEGTILIRDLIEEVSQYREIDGREHDYLDSVEEILGGQSDG